MFTNIRDARKFNTRLDTVRNIYYNSMVTSKGVEMIGANYIVKILPNKLILVRNNETKESKVLKPRELAAFFDEQLEDQIKEWDKNDESFVEIKSELSKL